MPKVFFSIVVTITNLLDFIACPEKVPKNLIIFKWQSYLTFITGILLLIVIYYANAKILMMDSRVNASITSFNGNKHLSFFYNRILVNLRSYLQV